MAITDPFKLEEKRHHLAKKKSSKAFQKTYSASMPAIVDKNTAKSWEKQLHDIPEENDPMTKDRIQATAHMIAPKSSETSLLDIGIGNAWVEKKVVQTYPNLFSVTGVDITKANLRKVKKEVEGKYYVGDVLQLPKTIEQQKYDYILLLEVLEHIPFIHTFDIMKKIHALLHDDGYFIISVPVNEDLEEKIAEGRNHSHHVRRYTPEILRYELELNNFEVVEEKLFYAFANYYTLKSIVARLTGIRKPNVVLLKCKKTS